MQNRRMQTVKLGGYLPSTAAVFPRWIAKAALCITKWKSWGLQIQI